MKPVRLLRTIARVTLHSPEQIYYTVSETGVECNICRYRSGRLKDDHWHPGILCPVCGSNVRHRLMWAALSLLEPFQKIILGKRVLHFSPEQRLGTLIKTRNAEYKTADYFTEGYAYLGIDYTLDISDMQQIPDAAFDCVIACDVLEHVPDDRKAMREVHRILSPGGYCIFTVPQKDYLTVTDEDINASPDQRLQRFGQYDHLRIYGNDFEKRVAGCGFQVTVIDEHSFNKKTAEKYVLFPPVLSKHPLATNFRKVYFGKKI